VEQYDFAEGTSSRSTKLIHGGIRYLELALRTGNWRHVRLVREALQQRQRVLASAPHLCWPLWLVTPCRSRWERWYYELGVHLYDQLAGRQRLGRPRIYRSGTLQRLFPGLAADIGIGFADGQFDDARLNWAIIRTAIAHGAIAVNHVAVTALEKHHGRVRGVVLRERWTGEQRVVSARVVVNAAGPQADTIRHLADPQAEPLLQPSAGAHLVLRPRGSLPPVGLLLPHTEDGRVAFLLPWHNRWLLGTTERAVTSPSIPDVSTEETAYLLRQLQPYLPQATELPITARWSGLRPLVRQSAIPTAQTVREHIIEEHHGLITLTGGKWTTYRRMAEELLDWLAARNLLHKRHSALPTSNLFGAPSPQGGLTRPYATHFWCEPNLIACDVVQHLQQYGTEAVTVYHLAHTYPGRLLEGWPFLQAEVIYAAQQEMACTPLDFLARRIRLAFLDATAAQAALAPTIALMARALHWDSATGQRMMSEAQEQLARLR
jgi:glycerol-3-phosphate dehydrogenase